jgi:hypothetical protein
MLVRIRDSRSVADFHTHFTSVRSKDYHAHTEWRLGKARAACRLGRALESRLSAATASL